MTPFLKIKEFNDAFGIEFITFIESNLEFIFELFILERLVCIFCSGYK